MPAPILTAAQTRAAEATLIAAGTSVERLMERAGAAVAFAARRFAGAMPTLILCGPGNNGGDGYVAARFLREAGIAVRVAASGEPRTEASQAARAAWGGKVESSSDARPAELLIDCLFGTGLTRGLDPDLAGALARLAAASRLRLAVDLPSGVATDDGALLSPVPAFDLTVALGALKPAHRLQPASAHCGRVVVADIGLIDLPRQLTDIERPFLPAPGACDHKYRRGYVAVVAGAMPGAARLATAAAQHAGAGYVTLVDGGSGGPEALVRRDGLDALDDSRIGAVVVGPGLGRDAGAAARFAAAVATGKPLLIDADALLLLRGRLPLAQPAILTPHEGEFGTLFGTLHGSKVDRARSAARAAGAVVVLKGADTVVAAPDGRAAIGRAAPAWLASAGTGDVLAGIAAAQLARRLASFEAACAAVWLHGEAARIAGPALIADDLVPAVSRALAVCG